jgi:hypothetical protein
MKLVFASLIVSSCAWADMTPAEIVRRATSREAENAALRRQYTYRESISERVGNRVDSKVNDVFFIGGKEFRKAIVKDGKPLTGKDAEKEQAKLDREIQKFKQENPAETRKRVAKQQREDEEFREQFAKGFDFRMVSEELVSSRPCYRVHAEPKVGFTWEGEAKVLGKLKGDMWIDKERFNWARLEAESTEAITGFAGLLRLAKGTTVRVDRTLINREVWFPEKIEVQAQARAALFIKAAIDVEIVCSNFRKYSVDSTITLTE